MAYIKGLSKDLHSVPIAERKQFILQLIETSQLKDCKPSIVGKLLNAVCIPRENNEVQFIVDLNLKEFDISSNLKTIAEVSA